MNASNVFPLHSGNRHPLAGCTFSAFATRFLGRDFLVLYADVVDGLHDNPDALHFYIGHEIGHIKRKHLNWGTVLLPASLLPLVGAAYARAREYTCDRHGLAAPGAGGCRWRTMTKTAFIEQARGAECFWMSFHELVGYPWLANRMAAVRALAAGREVDHPRRRLLATLLALFVPRLGVAGGGGVVRELRIDPVTAVLVFEPSMDENKRIASACKGEGIRAGALPHRQRLISYWDRLLVSDQALSA